MNPDSDQARFIGVARAGRAVDRALADVRRSALPGTTVATLDAVAARSLHASGAAASMLGYEDGHGGGPFPSSVSVCVNDEISGACDPHRVLMVGDLVTLDLAARVSDWHADAAMSFCVGDDRASGAVERSDRARLARAARLVTVAGVRGLEKRLPWGAVTEVMRLAADRLGVVLLRGFDGHGVGRAMHEAPCLPSHPDDLSRWPGLADQAVPPGRVMTIEPVVAWSGTEVVRNGWLDRTADGSDACFCEVTVAVGVRRLALLAGRKNLEFGG